MASKPSGTSDAEPDAEPAADATVDAREVEGEPFGAISAALEDLGADERLVVYNSFEPEPLYAVLERRGFDYETTQVDEDEWRVVVERVS